MKNDPKLTLPTFPCKEHTLPDLFYYPCNAAIHRCFHDWSIEFPWIQSISTLFAIHKKANIAKRLTLFITLGISIGFNIHSLFQLVKSTFLCVVYVTTASCCDTLLKTSLCKKVNLWYYLGVCNKENVNKTTKIIKWIQFLQVLC